MADEIEQLRAEVAALKKDVAHLLKILNQDDYDDPDFAPDGIIFEGDKLVARVPGKHIPFIVHACDDGVDMAFYDHQMRTRALLSVGEDRACLEFRNANGKLIAQLGEAADGSGQFCVCDAEGNPRAGIRATELGGLINVLNAEGKPQAMMMGSRQGGEIYAVNNQQRVGVKLVASDRGGIVTVHETSGQIMGYFSGDNCCGALTIHGPLGSPAVSLAASDAGGAVLFYDGDGVSTSMLP